MVQYWFENNHNILAQCPNACMEHCAECVSPDQCTCESGWSGDDCCTGIIYNGAILIFTIIL